MILPALRRRGRSSRSLTRRRVGRARVRDHAAGSRHARPAVSSRAAEAGVADAVVADAAAGLARSTAGSTLISRGRHQTGQRCRAGGDASVDRLTGGGAAGLPAAAAGTAGSREPLPGIATRASERRAGAGSVVAGSAAGLAGRAARSALVSGGADQTSERCHAGGDAGVSRGAGGRAAHLSGPAAGVAGPGHPLPGIPCRATKSGVAGSVVAVPAADLSRGTAGGRTLVAGRRDHAGEAGVAFGLARAARLIGAAAGLAGSRRRRRPVRCRRDWCPDSCRRRSTPARMRRRCCCRFRRRCVPSGCRSRARCCTRHPRSRSVRKHRKACRRFHRRPAGSST